MKILFILSQDIASPSGGGRYFPLAKELVKLGNEVQILALHPDYSHLPVKKQLISGVKVQYAAPMHVIKKGNEKKYYSPARLIYQSALATLRLSQEAIKIPADIVHIGKPHPMNGFAGLLKGLQRSQVYVDCDDDEAGSGVFTNNFQRMIISWFEKVIPRKANFITTNTHYTEERLFGFGIDKERIIYLSSGVDLERFPDPDSRTIRGLKSKLGINEEPVIAYIGSLSLSSHPVDLLFLAFREVIQQHPGIFLLVVGGGNDYHHLQELAILLGIADSVIFTGFIPANHVVYYYHLSNMVVDPVNDDRAARGRQPLKLFECWACGVPYLSADVGDRSKILGNPAAGILTKPGDVQSLAKSILVLLDNPQQAEVVRNLGKTRLHEYTWNKIAAYMNAEYLNRSGRSL